MTTRQILARVNDGTLRALRGVAHWRCQEPVLVFESDDWGLERRACADFLRLLGPPSEWADEDMETVDDLERLYTVLERHRDTMGRPACFTANFVMTNPDFDAIEREHYEHYHETGIGEQADLKRTWREGFERRVLFPQHHARRHFWAEAWLNDLRRDSPGARVMCRKRYPGGLSLVEGQRWRYHSEYLDWHSDRQPTPAATVEHLLPSLQLFEQVFGFASRSTIAPHFVFTPAVDAAWKAVGIKYVQGSGYRILQGAASNARVLSHAIGEVSDIGLLHLVRTVKFEPRRERPAQGLQQAVDSTERCFAEHIPAVVDTHRINYTGRHRQMALEALDALLSALRRHDPRYLTTIELGEAVASNGRYHDTWSGACRELMALDSPARRRLRGWLGWRNARLTNASSIEAR